MNELVKRIRVATKKEPADLVLKGGRVINVFSHEIMNSDVAISGDAIAAVGQGYVGKEEVDLQGRYIAPGLIDAHIHMESSMLHPRHLAQALLGCGTTTIIADPHEIANVAGLEGIKFMLDQTVNLPFDTLFVAPSCVPASHLETSGATIGPAELKRLAQNLRVLGLAEVMNFPGVVGAQGDLIEKIEIFTDKIIDGHAPGLTGASLQAYVSAGIRSDHECTTEEEALEKLRAGMMVFIREGTMARNLGDLLPLVGCNTASRFCFVTDDLHPEDILNKGHLNHILKQAISLGMDPVMALKLVTINPATFFRLYDKGSVGPGYRADLVIFDDLVEFRVWGVIKDGSIVLRGGKWGNIDGGQGIFSPESLRIMSVEGVSSEAFSIHCEGKKSALVIQLVPGQILTKASVREIEGRGGEFKSDIKRDILKIAVIERYKGSGRVGLGLVSGFGLKKGAIASSVAHDSHNIVVVGVDGKDMAAAVNAVARLGGGLVVADNGSASEELPLPIGGLMSPDPLECVAGAFNRVCGAAAKLGCVLKDPFMALSFMALPVIPELRVTDMGLVDVRKIEIVPLFW